MKKVAIFAVVMLCAGAAFASSLNVPWFADNQGIVGTDNVATTPGSIPPAAGTLLSLVYLHNNQTQTVTCAIRYFDGKGNEAGTADGRTTFSINPNASVAFRPVASDLGGQEDAVGNLVPDRNITGSLGADKKKNGSLVVQWVGAPSDVQGAAFLYSGTGPTSVGYLLPPGA